MAWLASFFLARFFLHLDAITLVFLMTGIEADEIRDIQAARAAIRMGDLETARRLILRQLQAQPDNPAALLLASYVTNDHRKRLVYVQRALQTDPEYQRAQERLTDLATPQPKRPTATAQGRRILRAIEIAVLIIAIIILLIFVLQSSMLGGVIGGIGCADGSTSHSTSRRGACSYHGGITK